MKPLQQRARLTPAALCLLLIALIALVLATAPAPTIQTEFGGATVTIAADRAWTLPGACYGYSWRLEGIRSLHIDGQGQIGLGEGQFCPSLVHASPVFEVRAWDETVRQFTLDVRLPLPQMLASLLVSLIIFGLGLAVWYTATLRLDEAPPQGLVWALALLWLLLAFCELAGWLSISESLARFRHITAQPAWHLVGIFISAAVFVPLFGVSLLWGWKTRAWADVAAVGGFALIMLLLYAPMGFDSIGHLEEWVVTADFEGKSWWALANESSGRFFGLAPHALAWLVSAESFVGFHVINLALGWAGMALFYGILRQLHIAPAMAFMMAALAFFYPVNPMLLNTRALGYSYATVVFLAAVHLALGAHRQPGRGRLLQMFLALALSAGSVEIAFVFVPAIPLLWWLRKGRWRWRSFNLTASFVLMHAAKALLLALYFISGFDFYGANNLVRGGSVFSSPLEAARHYAGILFQHYERTFALGWREAFAGLAQSDWLPHSILLLFIVGAIALYLTARRDAGESWLTRPQALLGVACGCLLILPASALFLLLSQYNQSSWHMFVLAPYGAAIAVFCLLTLAGTVFRASRWRVSAVIAMFLILALPAINRLYEQRAGFVESADAVAHILLQVVRQAPALHNEAAILLLTDRSPSELNALGMRYIHNTNLLDSAFYRLYGSAGPRYSLLCHSQHACYAYAPKSFDLRQLQDFSDIILFRLDDDMRVELLYALPPDLGVQNGRAYNPDALIDFDAPLPPRARTMLASFIDD